MSRNERISVIIKLNAFFFCFNHSFCIWVVHNVVSKYILPPSFRKKKNEGIELCSEKPNFIKFHLCDEKTVYSFISYSNSNIASFLFKFHFDLICSPFDSEADLSIVYFIFSLSSCVCSIVSLFCSHVYLLYSYNMFSFVARCLFHI